MKLITKVYSKASDMVNTLLVLAGGDGTRLRSVTGKISKPLIKIGGTEVITKILNKLVIELEISTVHLLIQKNTLINIQSTLEVYL